jgi:hypothetical protein
VVAFLLARVAYLVKRQLPLAQARTVIGRAVVDVQQFKNSDNATKEAVEAFASGIHVSMQGNRNRDGLIE